MESRALHHHSEVIEPLRVVRDQEKGSNKALSLSLSECYKWRPFRKPEVYLHPTVTRSPCFLYQRQPGGEPRLPLPPVMKYCSLPLPKRYQIINYLFVKISDLNKIQSLVPLCQNGPYLNKKTLILLKTRKISTE